jgi:hypothetical protein
MSISIRFLLPALISILAIENFWLKSLFKISPFKLSPLKFVKSFFKIFCEEFIEEFICEKL